MKTDLDQLEGLAKSLAVVGKHHPERLAAFMVAFTPEVALELIERIRKAEGDIQNSWRPSFVALSAKYLRFETAVKRVRQALDELARLGAGKKFGNSVGNSIAQRALAELDELAGDPIGGWDTLHELTPQEQKQCKADFEEWASGWVRADLTPKIAVDYADKRTRELWAVWMAGYLHARMALLKSGKYTPKGGE